MVSATAASFARRALQRARQEATAYAEMMMVHEVAVVRPAAAGTIDADGQESFAAEAVYSGKARMEPGRGPVTYTVGDEIQYFTSAAASLPLSVDDVRIDDLLQVTGHDDPAYVGLRFRVVDVETAGLLGPVRRVQLVGVQRSDQWVDTELKSAPTGPAGTIPPEWRLT